jgi:hypothetical protein
MARLLGIATAALASSALASPAFARFDEGLVLRSDDNEGEPAAESPDVNKMVADAVSDLKGFCDAMRSDFNALSSRMDSFDASRMDTEVPAGAAAEVPTPEETAVVEHPAVTVDTPAPAIEDAAIEAAMPAPVAADDMDMDAMADSIAARVSAPLRADIDRLSRMIPAELSIEQRQQFATAQEQAEVAFQSFGDHAPAPMQGESIGTYRRRLASKMQPHSAKWKNTKLTSISDDATLDVIVADIYNDAAAVARRGADVAPNQLLPVSRRTPAGHTIVEYRGSPGAWMRPLAGATRRATGKFNTGR